MTTRPLRTAATLALALIVAPAPALRAEVPWLRPAELAEQSTHIVVGTLRASYRATAPSPDAGFEQTNGLAEIAVTKVEKGTGPAPGATVFVRFWNLRWVGTGEVPPHSGGHDVPANGAAVRAHLRRAADGTYEALLPNGLAALPAPR